MKQSKVPALLAMLACGVMAQEAPQRGTSRVGDVHVYAVEQRAERKSSEETVTITAIDANGIRTLHQRTGRPEDLVGSYGPDWEVAVSGASGARFDPPVRMLAFPLQQGKTWEQTYSIHTPNGAHSQMKQQTRVVGMERIRTPAGEFDAFRIESEGYLSGVSWRGGFQVRQKAWYAPAIDRMVRQEYRESRALGADNVTELKSFKPAAAQANR